MFFAGQALASIRFTRGEASAARTQPQHIQLVPGDRRRLPGTAEELRGGGIPGGGVYGFTFAGSDQIYRIVGSLSCCWRLAQVQLTSYLRIE